MEFRIELFEGVDAGTTSRKKDQDAQEYYIFFVHTQKYFKVVQVSG